MSLQPQLTWSLDIIEARVIRDILAKAKSHERLADAEAEIADMIVHSIEAWEFINR